MIQTWSIIESGSQKKKKIRKLGVFSFWLVMEKGELKGGDNWSEMESIWQSVRRWEGPDKIM